MNVRVQNFLLDVAEFDLDPFHIEGKKNVIADLGSRHIPAQEDDNMLFLVFCSEDHVQLERFKTRTQGKDVYVKVRAKWKQYVPIKERRDLMWAMHIPKHGAYNEMMSALEEYHWGGEGFRYS